MQGAEDALALLAEMEAGTHHGHHALPRSGRALDALALGATFHCLTGCAIGEVAGMMIATALATSWNHKPYTLTQGGTR